MIRKPTYELVDKEQYQKFLTNYTPVTLSKSKMDIKGKSAEDIDKAQTLYKKEAYEEACENRRFEIKMYWHRATYYWAFIMSIYGAYFMVAVSDADFTGKSLILFGLSILATFFCFGFHLCNVGSKNWQENWETHVDLLENEFVGELYKTFIHQEHAYSVTKINIKLSMILFVASLLFGLGNLFYLVVSEVYSVVGPIGAALIWGLAIILLTFGFCCFYYGLVGNTKNYRDYTHVEYKNYGE